MDIKMIQQTISVINYSKRTDVLGHYVSVLFFSERELESFKRVSFLDTVAIDMYQQTQVCSAVD